MNKASVVIGYNTDPSVITNILCRNKSSIVVRVNGSAIDTSTVQHRNNMFYNFGHVGSAVLQYADTYLSQYFMMNPVLLHQDLQQLHALGIYPHISAHYDCLITTPYDMFINQFSEKYDAGFAETLQRSENPRYALQFKDITNNEVALTLKLLKIRDEYFVKRIQELCIDISKAGHLMTDEFIEKFIYNDLALLHNVGGWNDDRIVLQENVVFEGVPQTPSNFQENSIILNNVLENAICLSQKSNITTLDIFYAVKNTSVFDLDAFITTFNNDKKYLSPDIHTHFNIVFIHPEENIECSYHQVRYNVTHGQLVQLIKDTLLINICDISLGNSEMVCIH